MRQRARILCFECGWRFQFFLLQALSRAIPCRAGFVTSCVCKKASVHLKLKVGHVAQYFSACRVSSCIFASCPHSEERLSADRLDVALLQRYSCHCSCQMLYWPGVSNASFIFEADHRAGFVPAVRQITCPAAVQMDRMCV